MHVERVEVSGSEARSLIGKLSNFIEKLTSLVSSKIDHVDAETTKLQLESEAASETKYKELRAETEKAELRARKATAEAKVAEAEAQKAKAHAERRRAEKSWRPPPKQMIQEAPQVQEPAKVKRGGFRNDSLREELSKVRASP